MKIDPITLSPAFYDLHHFHVRTVPPVGSDNPDGELVGMFATLYCAAQTALHDRRTPKYVRDVKAGVNHEVVELSGLRLDNMRKLDLEPAAIRRDKPLNGRGPYDFDDLNFVG